MSKFDQMMEHSSWLQPLARSLIRDEHMAEDAVQETWIRAWRRPPRDQQAGPAWLRQVLHNLVRMQFRRDGRRRNRERLAARAEIQRDDLPLEALELRRQIVRMLMALEEPFRSTLILHFYEDLSSAEIARLEGIPAATVRGRLKRGLDRLREQLHDERGNYTAALFLISGLERPGARALPTSPSGRVIAAAMPAGSTRTHLTTAATLLVSMAAALMVWWLFEDSSAADDATVASNGLSREASEHRGRALPTSATDTTPARTRPPVTMGNPPSPGTTAADLELLAPLDDDRWVQLRVIDSHGRSVANARVASGRHRLQLEGIAAGYASTFGFLLAEPCPDLLGHTANDGMLRVSTESLRDTPLAVSAEHFMTSRERPTHRAFIDGVYTVTLLPGLDTEITVEAEDGTPLLDCAIAVSGREATARYSVDGGSRVRHTSHDDVELVSFRATGFAAVQDLLASPRHHQRLVYGRPASGTVVDADGRGVEGAVVSMRSTLWRGPAHTVTTDARGRFETFGLAASGTLELQVLHPAYPRRASSHTLPCTELGDVVLNRPQRLRGRVLMAAGSPCPDALILALPEGQFLSRDVVRSRSDAEGFFEFSALATGNYVLRAEHDGFAFAEQSVKTSDRHRTTLTLGTGASISGRVQTERGQPVAGVPIRIGVIVGDELRGPIVHSDADGRFRVDGLPRGTVEHRPRRRVLRWRALDASDGPDGRTSDLVAELFLPYQLLFAGDMAIPQPAHFGSRNTVAVRVGRELRLVISDRKPQPPVRFELTDTSGFPLRAFSNILVVSPDGWMMKDFAGVNGQPYHLPNPWRLDRAQLTVMSRGYCWQTVRVDLRGGAGNVRFALHPTFERPPILASDATVPTQLLVAPRLSGVTPLAALPVGSTDADGRLMLTDLGPGAYALCTPRDPKSLFGNAGKRRLAMPMDELLTVGHFTLSAVEGQIVRVQLATTTNLEEAR